MDNTIKFRPKNAAKNPDAVLEQSIGQYESLIIVGYNKGGRLDARASLNIGHADIHWMISLFQHKLLNGDYSSENTND